MEPDNIASLSENKGSALALYEGAGENDLIDEVIDERILSLLGLDDVFDIDYGTYISLLKERLVASRNFDKKLSSEEDELLVGEFKRVKGKVGRFKLKRKKVTSEDIGVTGPIRVSANKFLLAGKAIIPEQQERKEDSDDIKGIEKALDNLLKSITLQNKEKKKVSEDERKKSEDRKRRAKEGDLEKPLTQLKALAKKIIAPAQGILDRIFRFIKFTLLGYAFNQLIKWFSDPKNADKIKTLGRFLKDWWPALLTAYGLFATPFGKFIRGTLKMLRGFIPQIARFIAANPVLAATAAAGIGAYVMSQKNESYREELKKTEPSIVTPKETRETGKTPGVPQLQQEQVFQRGFGGAFKGGGIIPRSTKSFFGGGLISKEIDARDIAFEGGGGIDEDSGVKIKGAGVDTQLIAARPGEIVMSKEAVDKYGANFFLDLNKKGGGTNVPRMVNNIQLAAGGGLIKKTIKSYQGGGMVGSKVNMPMPFSGMRSVSKNTNQIMSSNTAGRNSNVSNTKPWWQSINPFSNKKSPSNGLSELPRLSSSQNYSKISGFSKDNSADGLRMQKNDPYNAYTKSGFSSPISTRNIFPSIRTSSSPSISYSPVNISTKTVTYPKQRISPPGPPVVYTKTTYTVLPPIKSPSKTPSAVSRGDKIPKFNISSDNDSRSKIASSLGIADLVGVS